MRTSRLPLLLRSVCLVAIASLGGASGWAQTFSEADVSSGRSAWGLSHLLDDLPTFLVKRMPLLAGDGTVQVSVRPHLGDFFHSDYVRVPVGVRWRVAPRVELSDELDSYYAHKGNHAGDYGLSGTTLGAKWEPVFPTLAHPGLSLGLDFRTPFARSPHGFSDGYRHVQPYIATTSILVPQWRLIGYANLGANFFQHTSLPSNFGRNQLHANSLALAAGLARDWSFVRASLTARLASTALTSDEGRQNFQLRPEIAFPLRHSPDARTQILLTLGGRVMWGPNGRQINTNGGFRVNFHLDREHRERSLEDIARFPL